MDKSYQHFRASEPHGRLILFAACFLFAFTVFVPAAETGTPSSPADPEHEVTSAAGISPPWDGPLSGPAGKEGRTMAKAEAMADMIRSCTGCRLPEVKDVPISQCAERMPVVTRELFERYGKSWTFALAINDIYLLSHCPVSGYIAPVHLVTPENAGSDGGPRLQYDPDNGYREIYRRIWKR